MPLTTPVDDNTKLLLFLQNTLASTNPDLTSLINRYLATLTGDYNSRWLAMVASARTFVG